MYGMNEDTVTIEGVLSTPQSSVLPPMTVVKSKVKGQEAKTVKVRG